MSKLGTIFSQRMEFISQGILKSFCSHPILGLEKTSEVVKSPLLTQPWPIPSGCWGPKAGSGCSFQGKVHRIRSVLHVLTHSSAFIPPTSPKAKQFGIIAEEHKTQLRRNVIFFFFFSCGTTKVDSLSRGSSELFSSPQPPSFLKYSVTQSFPGCTHIFVIPARVNE